MTPARDADPPMSLNRQIDVVGRRLGERRRRIAEETATLRQGLRQRLTSPGALLAAIGVGIALEQSKHRGRWSLLRALNVLNAGVALLATISRRKPQPPGAGNPSVR